MTDSSGKTFDIGKTIGAKKVTMPAEISTQEIKRMATTFILSPDNLRNTAWLSQQRSSFVSMGLRPLFRIVATKSKQNQLDICQPYQIGNLSRPLTIEG